MPKPVQNFIQAAQQITSGPDMPAPDTTGPKVPFQSNLKLTAEQEKLMIEHAFTRYRTLTNELGRDQTLTPTWWQNQTAQANTFLASQGLAAADTFMGKRSRYDATFLNDVSWRPWTMGPDNIFMSSNFAVPINRRICRQMIAKAQANFFGSDPWFSISPAPVPEFDGQPDAERAIRIERFCRFKLREAASKDDKERAIKRAFILGECPVKTSYVVRDQVFNVEARVLHSADTGQPIRASDGNYITEEDQFVDAEDGTGRRVLARDRGQPEAIEEPLAPIWQNIPLDRRQVLFEGARSEPIFYKDFLCPITAPSVQEADCIIHLYDKPVFEFVDLVVKRGMVGDTTPDRIGAAQKMVALVKSLASNSPQPKSAANQQIRPNDNFAAAPSVETGGPIAEFAEFYMWYDANGDGVAENIMLICDRNTQAPIFYDHVANVTTDGLRPIEIVRVNPVEGRWYGLGVMEMFESYQNITDLLVNRWNFSQSRAGRVDLWTPTNTVEGDRDPNLKMNWGGTYQKKPGMKKEDVLESVYLTDIKFDQVQAMIQFFLQLCLNESGVSTANDAKMAGMASDSLATGIIETTKSGEELLQPMIADLRPSLENILTREIEVTLANMNPKEVYVYLEGDSMGIDSLTPDDVRGLRFKTKIELTTMKNNQDLQSAAMATQLVEKFYALMPEIQIRTAQFYRKQLRVLDPSADADTVIQPLMPMLGAMPGGAPQPGGEESSGAGTPFSAQLGQKSNQMPGVSAAGGTPAA
jgi:hypothetical protein